MENDMRKKNVMPCELPIYMKNLEHVVMCSRKNCEWNKRRLGYGDICCIDRIQLEKGKCLSFIKNELYNKNEDRYFDGMKHI